MSSPSTTPSTTASTTPLATSQAVKRTLSATQRASQTVFSAGNGRFFASVRTNGSTRFLGTFDGRNAAQGAVDSFLAGTGAVSQPTFQFY